MSEKIGLELHRCWGRVFLFTSLWLAVVCPAYGGWREAVSEKFIVYSDGSEKQLIDFTQRVEKFDQVLRMMTGSKQPPSPVKLRVYLVSGAQAVQGLMPKPKPNVGGFYNASMAGGIGVLNRDRATNKYGLGGETILYHEYTHHFMYQYFPSAYPIWYQEGFAEYFSTMAFTKKDVIEVGGAAVHRLPALFDQDWFESAVLMESTLEELPSSKWDRFYAQSWLLTHYFLSSDKRRPQISAYIELRNNGAPHGEALKNAFGLTDDELDAELRRYFSNGKISLLRITGQQFTTPTVSVRQLSESEGLLLLPRLRLEIGVGQESLKKFMDSTRKLVERFPDDSPAQATLAAAEARYGNHSAAIGRLETFTAADPQNRRAWLDLARCYLNIHQPDESARRASDRKARTAAVKAHQLMAEDPEALLLFYKSFRSEKEGPTDNAVDGLARAHENLPQNGEIRWLFAGEMLRRKEPKYAIRLLKPIAYSPHGGAHAVEAQKWIKDIEANQDQGFAATLSEE